MNIRKRTIDYFSKYFTSCYQEQLLRLELAQNTKDSVECKRILLESNEHRNLLKSIVEIREVLSQECHALDTLQREARNEAMKDYFDSLGLSK